MHVKNCSLAGVLLLGSLAYPAAIAAKKGTAAGEVIAGHGPAVIWRTPDDFASRNLFYGPGGRDHVPKGPFRFEKEDLDGTSPKFVVVDAGGVRWKVKLGLEARPEPAASRLVWAVGYFASEDYFVRDLLVQGMPARLHRGAKLVNPDGSMHNARLKREDKDDKKLGNWSWLHDNLVDSRELNGLKVMMALINDWDLKDINNAIEQDGSERIFLVSDLGASFGSAGRTWPMWKAKDNIASYSRSRFIRRVTPEAVDFEVPARPRWVLAVNPKEFFYRIHLRQIGRNVPRGDVEWVTGLLARLSPDQIRDAFRASGYSPQEVEEFAAVVERRIADLKRL